MLESIVTTEEWLLLVEIVMLGFIVDQDLQDLTQLKKFMETFVQLEGIASKDL